MSEPYRFADALPVEPISPGTTVLVSGPSHSGSRRLAFRLLGGDPEEGVIVVATNETAGRIVERCRAAGDRFDLSNMGVVSCVEDGSDDIPGRVLTVAGPGDLTGIGMRYSKLYRDFHREGVERVRTGLHSVSTLLSFADLRPVSRFVHTLAGRVDAVDGFGAFLIDPTIHDERAVNTIAQFCDGRIDVREGDSGPECRVRGLSDQPRGWAELPF